MTGGGRSRRSSIADRIAPTSIDRRIIALAIPAFGALSAEPLYRLVDTAIVGRLGTAELGGVAVAIAVLLLVVAGSNFLAYGTTEQVARRIGAGDDVDAAEVGVQALWLSGIVGAVAAPTVALGARPLCSLLGASGEILDYAVVYLRISAIGIPFVVIGLAAQGTQRGASDYRSALIILVGANVVNATIEIIAVVGLGWGVAGAAWSTVISQIAAGVVLWWRTMPLLRPARRRRPSWERMAPLASAGRHLIVRVGSMLVVFTGSTAVAARIGPETLAAHQIAMTMFSFLALSLDALAVPAQTLVAERIGVGRGAAEVAARTVRLSAGIGMVGGILLAAGSPIVARVFTADAAVVERATVALVVLAVILIPGAVAFATDGALIGAGDYRFLGRAAFAYLVAVVPLGVVVLAAPRLGIVGIWVSLLVWMVLRAVVNSRRVRTVLGTPSAP